MGVRLLAIVICYVFSSAVSAYYLDARCGGSVYARTYASTFSPSLPSAYLTPCLVAFRRTGPGQIQVTVSGGQGLNASQCHVNVLTGPLPSSHSLSHGDIHHPLLPSPFSLTFTSDLRGLLYVRVQGQQCASSDLQVSVQKVLSSACSGFLCRNGRCVLSSGVCDGVDDCDDRSDEDDCFWTPGRYAGVVIGVLVFFLVVAVLSGLFYRRRRQVIIRRASAIMPPGKAVVTHSRW